MRDRILNALTLALVMAAFVPPLAVMPRWMAAKAAGMVAEADDLKITVGLTFLLAFLGVTTYIMLWALKNVPAAFNYPVEVTDRNREALHRLGRELVAASAAALALTFVASNFGIMLEDALPGLTLAVTMAAVVPLLIVAAVYIAKMYKLKDKSAQGAKGKR